MVVSSQESGEGTEDGSDTTHVVCSHCKYEWDYSGEMWQATCPRCSRKTSTGLRPDEADG